MTRPRQRFLFSSTRAGPAGSVLRNDRGGLDFNLCAGLDEAADLDEGRFEDWLDLFTDDGWYWVPIAPDQDNPRDTVSLIYDDRRLLETRVRRLVHPGAHAQTPASRTSRIIANVTEDDGPADGADKAGADFVVRSKFQMIEYRRDAQRLFAGTCMTFMAKSFHEVNSQITL